MDGSSRGRDGKSYVRFKCVADLPLDLIGQTIAERGGDNLLATYKSTRSKASRKEPNIDMQQIIPILYEILRGVASTHSIVYYSDLGDAVGLAPIGLGKPLGEISEREHKAAAGRPMLSAVVVSKESDIPSIGFFQLVKDLGLYAGPDDDKFWEEELERVHQYWKA